MQYVLVLNAMPSQTFKLYFHVVSNPKFGQLFFKEKDKSIVNGKSCGKSLQCWLLFLSLKRIL
jgi:hypothetical protein